MEKLVRYIETRQGRAKVIVILGRFGVIGGLIVAAILLAATFL